MPESQPGCPLCGHSMRPWLQVPCDWRRPERSHAYETFWCRVCAYGRVDPLPRADEVPAFYDVPYYTHTADENEDDEASTTASFAARVREHLAWRADKRLPTPEAVLGVFAGPPLRICEIGCGKGELSRKLREAGHDMTCVEIDPKARALAKKYGLEVHEGTAEALPAALATSSFDAVLMVHVLEHCVDPDAAVANVARLLEPNGRFVCEVPNNICLGLERAGATWAWLDVPRHLHFFSESSLRAFCETHLLHVEAVRYTGYSRQISASWIDEEQRIYDALRARTDSSSPMSSRNQTLRAWGLLAHTAFADDARKYDSVMIVARA